MHLKTLVLLSITSYSLAAWSHPVEEASKKAEAALQSKDYASAIHHYNDALQHETETPELHYGLATAHFRAGNYEQAAVYFSKVSETSPLYAAALLHQGVIAIRHYQLQEANAHLRAVIHHAPETESANLADELLAQIETENTPIDPEFKPHIGFVAFGMGFEDAVLSPTTEAVLKKLNPYTEINTHWVYNIFSSSSQDSSVYAGGVANLNGGAPENNQGMVTTGAEHLFKRERTRVSFGVESSLDFLDDSFIEFSTYGFAKIQQRWRTHTTLRARATAGWVEALDDAYTFNTGWQQRLRGEWKWKYAQTNIGALYEYEINQRENQGDKKNYINYSPTRHTYKVGAGYSVSKKWNVQTTTEYRFSRYPENNIYDGTPARRYDERLRALLSLGFQWSGDLSYQLTYAYQRTVSTIKFYDGVQNNFSLGINLAY